MRNLTVPELNSNFNLETNFLFFLGGGWGGVGDNLIIVIV